MATTKATLLGHRSATSFSDLTLSGDLTVNGTTTTLDTAVQNVDKLEIGASSTDYGAKINQASTGNILQLQDGGTDVMVVKDGGNVGIGISSPSVPLAVSGDGIFTSTTGAGITVIDSDDKANGWQLRANGTRFQIGEVGVADRFAILAGGYVGIGTVSPANILTAEYGGGNGLLLKNTNNSGGQFARFTRISSGDTTNGDWIFNHSSKSLLIQTNSSGGSFSSPSFSTVLTLEQDGDVRLGGSTLVTSDERFKENIEDASPKLDDLMRLRVRNFNFTADSNVGGFNYSKKRIGFIAQEFSEVFPNLVKPFWHQISENDEEAVERLSIRENTLIPIIVKAIQELSAKVTELENATN